MADIGTSKAEMTAIMQFSTQFTLFLSLWNQVETSARRILQLMLGESITAMGVAAEIQNRSLEQALRTGARDPNFSNVRDHIEHFVEGYKRLLAYRNYYVHALFAVMPDGGRMLSLSAKGKLKFEKALLTMADVEKNKNYLLAMIDYVTALEKEMGGEGTGLDALIEAYGASLNKPQWPPILTKNPILLQKP